MYRLTCLDCSNVWETEDKILECPVCSGTNVGFALIAESVIEYTSTGDTSTEESPEDTGTGDTSTGDTSTGDTSTEESPEDTGTEESPEGTGTEDTGTEESKWA